MLAVNNAIQSFHKGKISFLALDLSSFKGNERSMKGARFKKLLQKNQLEQTSGQATLIRKFIWQRRFKISKGSSKVYFRGDQKLRG